MDLLPWIAKHGAPDIAIVSPFLPSEIDPPKAVEPLCEQNTWVILLIGSLSPQELERHYIPLAIYDLIPNPITLQAIEHALTTLATLGEAQQQLKKLPLLNSRNAPVIEELPEEKRSSSRTAFGARATLARDMSGSTSGLMLSNAMRSAFQNDGNGRITSFYAERFGSSADNVSAAFRSFLTSDLGNFVITKDKFLDVAGATSYPIGDQADTCAHAYARFLAGPHR